MWWASQLPPHRKPSFLSTVTTATPGWHAVVCVQRPTHTCTHGSTAAGVLKSSKRWRRLVGWRCKRLLPLLRELTRVVPLRPEVLNGHRGRPSPKLVPPTRLVLMVRPAHPMVDRNRPGEFHGKHGLINNSICHCCIFVCTYSFNVTVLFFLTIQPVLCPHCQQ